MGACREVYFSKNFIGLGGQSLILIVLPGNVEVAWVKHIEFLIEWHKNDMGVVFFCDLSEWKVHDQYSFSVFAFSFCIFLQCEW